jgi:uncharacterized phage protein (TIGR02218 family)
MKSIAPDLINCGSLVCGVRVVRKDGTVLGWTQHDRDQAVDVDVAGVPTETTLLANPGFNIQSLVSSAGLGVDNTDIYVISAEDEMKRVDILNRLWDGCSVYFFRYSWKHPELGIIPLKRGWFGNFTPMLGQFKCEFRDLRQAWQQNTTWLFQEGCRWRLGDARCSLDLAPFTFEDEITSGVTAYAFVSSGLVQASDYFGEGYVEWLTGANIGRVDKVKAFAAGLVTLSEAPIRAMVVGDAFRIIAGCRKRWSEDCKTKFDNLLNYGGEKDKGTRDELIKPGVPG